MLKHWRKLEIGVRVKKDDKDKVELVLEQYLCKGTYMKKVKGEGDYIWIFMKILEKNEKKLDHDIWIMQLVGIDVRG